MNRFFRSALFPLIVIVLLVFLASRTLLPGGSSDTQKMTFSGLIAMVEDIIDSGLTLSYLMRNLQARKPASLEICALLTKPGRREIDVPVRYVGFEIPNKFVIGYGLDFAERYRNLPYVGVLHPDLIPGSGP